MLPGRRARAAGALPLRHDAGARSHDRSRSRPIRARRSSRRSTSSTRSRRSRSRARPATTRRCAIATRRSPTTCGSTAGSVRVRSPRCSGCAARRPKSSRRRSTTATRRRRATTPWPSRARSCRCSGTSTRWARRSGSRSIPTRRNPTVLLDIPTWNFDWQMNYGLAKPLHVDRRAEDPDGLLVGSFARSEPGAEVHRVRGGNRRRDVLRDLRDHSRRPVTAVRRELRSGRDRDRRLGAVRAGERVRGNDQLRRIAGATS